MSNYEMKPMRRCRKAARNAVRSALRNGSLKPEPCLHAGGMCRGKVVAHHYLGYDEANWLDVIWVCTYHHRLEHKLMKAGLGSRPPLITTRAPAIPRS